MLRYSGPNPTVDVVVLRRGTSGDEVLLIRRRRDAEAEAGKWALPGGFHDSDAPAGGPWRPGREAADAAAARELAEETGLDLRDRSSALVFVGTYEGGGRDPRDGPSAWTRSQCFAIRLPADVDSAVSGADDAEAAAWLPVGTLSGVDLAFDHEVLIRDTLALLRQGSGG